MTFAVTRAAAIFLTVTEPLFTLLCSGTDRSAVTGKGKVLCVDQSLCHGSVKELLLVESKNKQEGVVRFERPAFQQRKKFRGDTGRIAGSFIALLFPFRRFHFRETILRGEVIGIILPDAGKEIIKSTDTRSIAKGEAAEDGIQRSFLKHAAPPRNGRDFKLECEQVGAEHTGREPWMWPENGVTFLHNGIGEGKVEIPELNDVIPSVFRKSKGIGVKIKELGYERILIGGMAAGVTG